METFDLPSDRVAEVFALKAVHPKLSANDCFCLVTTRCHQDAILLTGDSLLRRVASGDGRHVHGVLWVVDELKRLALCGDDIIGAALELWQSDAAVFFLLLKSNVGCDLFGVQPVESATVVPTTSVSGHSMAES